MKQLFFVLCVVCLFALSVAAQNSWIPKGANATTILVEHFKYCDPNSTLYGVDEDYEDMRDEFLEKTNESLENYNQQLGELFKNYKYSYELVMLGKVEEMFPDKQKYRYMLRREPYFGKKKVVTNSSIQSKEDQSYCGYRYYFYDRLENKKLAAYYFSGDQWVQIQRIIFWLNNAK